MSKPLSTRVIRGLIYNLIGIVVPTIASIIIVRLLGPINYGIFSYLSSTFLLVAPLYSMGLDAASLRYVAELNAIGDKKHLSNFISKVVLTQIFILLLLTLMLVILINFLNVGRELYVLFMLMGFVYIPATLSTLFSNILHALYEQKIINLFNVLTNILQTLAIWLILSLNYGVLGLIFIILLFTLLRALAFGLRVASLGLFSKSFEVSKEVWVRFRKYALDNTILAITGTLVWGASEQIFLTIKGWESVGYYVLAYSTIQSILEFAGKVTKGVALPAFTELRLRGVSELRRAAITLNRLIFIYSIPVSMIIMILSDNLYLIWGEAMSGSLLLFRVLPPILCLSMLGRTTGTVLLALEKTKIIVIFNSCFTALLFILDYLLIPNYGLLGAVLSVYMTFTLASTFFYIYTSTLIGPFIPKREILKYIASSLLLLIFLPITSFINNIIELLLVAASMVGVYWVGIKVLKALTPEDKRLIRRIDPLRIIL